MTLINKDRALFLTDNVDFHYCHGALKDYLGLGMIYYMLPYILKAKTCVCIGSGGGFVPSIMRQAQIDMGIANISETHLIDANLPEAGWCAPNYVDDNSTFRKNHPDIKIHIIKSVNAVQLFDKIDYLHIDADHSFEGTMADFLNYKGLMSENSAITFHDTGHPDNTVSEDEAIVGINRVIDYIRTLDDYELINFPENGGGAAIVRKRLPVDCNKISEHYQGWRTAQLSDGTRITTKKSGT